MNTKTIVGGLIGGVVFFLLGWLVWGFLLKDTMTSCTGCMRPEEDLMNMKTMVMAILSNLLYGIFLAWVLSKFAGVNSFSTGLKNGALFMALLGIAMDLGFYAYSTMFTSMSCMLIDIVLNIVMGGIVGGVIGWWFGRK